MADNYLVNPGAGPLAFASDEDVGGVHWPFFKLAWGPRDTFNEVDDAAGKRLPVLVGNFPATYPVTDNGGSLTVDGTVGVSSVPADPFGANADAESPTGSISAKLRFIASTGIPITGTVTVTGGLTDAQLRASAVPVDTELPAAAVLADNTANPTVPGVGAFLMAWDGTNWDRVQTGAAAGGALKVDGSAVTQPVSGTVTANMGTVTADPFGANADAASATGSISAKLRFIASTGIPVTGTVTVAAHNVTNAGTFVVQENGAALTALQLIDDPVVVLGTATYTEATSKGFAVAAVRRDADTTLVDTTNEFAPLQLDARGFLKVECFSGETLPVSGTVTANMGTVTADPFGANADAASATGSISAKLRFIASTGIPITGTVTVALAAGTNTNEVVGDVAHDSPIGGNPLRIGARALSADYTAVATGDTADLITTLLGKLVVKPHALPGQSWQFASASGGLTDTTGVTIKAAGAAGVRNYVTDLLVTNGHASVGTEVVIRDGASGTVIHRGWAQAGGGGYSLHFASPLRGTAATLLEVACITTGSAVRVSAGGYEGAE